MKKKSILLSLCITLMAAVGTAQILPVKVCTQEQDQWCWAGVSQCVLDYYNTQVDQCDIAEYARSVITWRDFGSDHCCDNPEGPCNYWNYNWGYAGSIKDILIHFNQLDNTGITSALSQTEVMEQITLNRPFVIRWGWYYGGGHFVVGHGLENETIYYMDPWFGEGAKLASYSWVLDDGEHTWTHTNTMSVSSTTGVDEISKAGDQVRIFPNPNTTGNFVVENLSGSEVFYTLYSSNGQMIRQGSVQGNTLPVSIEGQGIYILKITSGNGSEVHKLVVN